ATFTHTYLQAGTYTAVFTVTSQNGQSAQTSLTVVVGNGGYNNSNLNITTTALPAATVGSYYSAPISATGGTGNYSWSISSGTLPPGLSLVTAQCFSYPCQVAATITGTPTSINSGYVFQVSLSDGISRVYQNFNLAVVYGGTQSSAVTIYSITPMSGSVGTQVTINGTGFGYNGCNQYSCTNTNYTAKNTVNFGSNVIPNIYSYNGTSLTFTVPTYVSPACLYSNPACYVSQSQLTPGTYPVSVTNTSGTSNAINFNLY
ncbi:MAG TPA: putative Ig domain-containing protein, partial [Candidatus Paceibacterota bacterium]|nr:putative Ig domain-containing protein [Candidatus Paceibacterota bacterium]